ncbi:hypothetical protein F2Q69_00060406 [Brassica cretica]|uniref:CCT domain-containing protein n=1 Tax=Brassica cretica TaxID=69181 RepID=A0A8S9RCM8_BRACR|nr:hypothetical protein F2Q69_00060406 [Brassica cretica]
MISQKGGFTSLPETQTLGTRNAGQVQSQLDRIIVSCTSEDRREKLSRYRDKKSRRNFGRKIKYACRKTLADSQPRIRGRLYFPLGLKRFLDPSLPSEWGQYACRKTLADSQPRIRGRFAKTEEMQK